MVKCIWKVRECTQYDVQQEENMKCKTRTYILGECLLISSLPSKALRMLVDTARLVERFNMRSQSLAWYSIYQFTHCFTLQAIDYDVIFDFCIDSVSLATH